MAWEKFAKEAAESDILVIGSYELVASSSAVGARGRAEPWLWLYRLCRPAGLYANGSESESPSASSSSVGM